MSDEGIIFDRPFKLIIHPKDKNRHKNWPQFIPMNFVAKFSKKIQENHCQSITELYRRGGLTPAELYYAMSDMPISAIYYDPISDEEAMEVILNELEIYYREGGLKLEKTG